MYYYYFENENLSEFDLKTYYLKKILYLKQIYKE